HEARPREAGFYLGWRFGMVVLHNGGLVIAFRRGVGQILADFFQVFLGRRFVRGFDFAEHLERIALLFLVSEIHGANTPARQGLRALTPLAATLMPNRRVTFARRACASSAQTCTQKAC